MTEQKTDKPADAVWEKATSVITARILALRERQAAEKQEDAK